jgi:hypothetical protein
MGEQGRRQGVLAFPLPNEMKMCGANYKPKQCRLCSEWMEPTSGKRESRSASGGFGIQNTARSIIEDDD